MGEEDRAAPTEVGQTVLGEAVPETEAHSAWSLDDGEEWAPPRRLSPSRITAVAVAASLGVIAAAGVVAYVHLNEKDAPVPASPPASNEKPPIAAAPSPTPSPTAAPSPLAPEGTDAEFIAAMRGFGVPVVPEDPWWVIDLADAVCDTALEEPHKYPPGTSTVILLVEGVAINNPDWTRQQVSRFVGGAVDFYCPEVRGPSLDEIAAMPPDDRYLAILQDRLGITPVNNTLVDGAKQICSLKAQGYRNDQILDGMNSPNPREDEQIIIETAVDVYCPEYRGR